MTFILISFQLKFVLLSILINDFMKTVTIEIKNDIAMSFLHNLESMDILRVIENKTDPGEKKLSERFAGCLSKERTEELQKELIQMRSEWERDTY